MAARRVPVLAVPVDARAGVDFLGYANRTPLLTIATARPALLVTPTIGRLQRDWPVRRSVAAKTPEWLTAKTSPW